MLIFEFGIDGVGWNRGSRNFPKKQIPRGAGINWAFGVDIAAFENLRESLEDLDKEGFEIILVGDTNCDFKTIANANAKRLKLVYSEYQLEQLIKKYTI